MASSLSINGKVSKASTPLDYSEGLLVNAQCFDGILGLTTCMATNLDQPNAIFEDLPYYYNFNSRGNQPYCVQCCGNNAVRVDTWALSCTMNPVTLAQSNVFGYEFRFTRRAQGPEDSSSIIRCPIWRSECNYFPNGTASFCPKIHANYLIGYTLTLNIQEYDVNFEYWRGVESCLVTTYESNTSLPNQGKFTEEILLVYNNDIGSYQVDDSRLAFIALILLVFMLAGLYFIRKQLCVVCQRKLIICSDRCFTCRILGADTDRELIYMLREKGAILQGDNGRLALPALGSATNNFSFHKQHTRIKKVVPLPSPEPLPRTDNNGDVTADTNHLAVRAFLPRLLQKYRQRLGRVWQREDEEEEEVSTMTYRIRKINRKVVLQAIGHPCGDSGDDLRNSG